MIRAQPLDGVYAPKLQIATSVRDAVDVGSADL